MNPTTTSAIALRDDRRPAVIMDPSENALSTVQLLGQVQLIQQVMVATMREGEHWGKIPGCGDKPALLKPGAEKLCLTFRLAPAYAVQEKDLGGDHREYQVTTTLTSILTGVFVGQGVGICSTRESKYRYRGATSEATDRPVPRGYWDLRQENPAKAQELIGGKGFTTKKVEGQGWMIARTGEKAENPDIPDVYNTVLKMAKKRSLVDAVLTVTAASDLFMQDLEDVSANLAAAENGTAPTPATPANAARPAQDRPRASSRPAPRNPVPADLSQQSAGDGDEYQRQSTGDVDEPGEFVTAAGVRIHFGKNRGTDWREMTDNQRNWYQDDWAKGAKKKGAKLLSPDDRALLTALDEMVSGVRDPGTGALHPATEAEALLDPDASAEDTEMF